MGIFSYRIQPVAAQPWNPMGKWWGTRTVFADAVAQVTQIRFTAGDLTADTSFSVTDDATGQVYGPVVGTGNATEATMLDNAVAALELSELGRKLFTFTEDGVDDVVATARHANRAYTWEASGGSSATPPAVTITTAASGPERLPFGFVAKGSAARSVTAIGASTELADLAGILHRNEARSLRQLPELADDGVERETLSIDRNFDQIAIPYEAGSEPGASVFLRRALTSGAGTVGVLRAAPAGSAQVSTYTPVADMLVYAFEYGYGGEHRTVIYRPTDGTTAVADAVDGLVAAANDDGPPAGVTITDTETEVTITTAAGTQLDYLRNVAVSLDADTPAGAAALGAADIDTIDVSSIVEVLEVLDGLNLALCRVVMD